MEDCLAEDFDALCRELAAQVAAIYSPDLVVGIHRGGAQVAEAMLAVDVIDARLCFVTARRPASPAKSRARLDVVLGRLPRRINDGLRVAEHTVRTRRRG